MGLSSDRGKPGDAHRAEFVPVVLRMLTAWGRRRGVDPARLLRGSGLEPVDLDAPALRVSYEQCRRVARRLRAASPFSVPDVLDLGRSLHLVSLGKVGLGMAASADSHAVFRFLVDHQRAAGFLSELRTERTPRRFSICVQPRFDDPELGPWLGVLALAAVHGLGCQILAPDFRAAGVELALPRPADPVPYLRFFGCPVAFDAACHRLDLPPAPQPVPTAEPCVAVRMRELLRHAAPPARQDYGAVVAQIVRRDPSAAPPLARIAAELHLSERSLRRKLAAEGLNYRGLVAEAKSLRTLALVRGSAAPLKEVAAQTGYANARSLRRAVHRWTGQGPMHLRQEGPGDAGPGDAAPDAPAGASGAHGTG